MNAQAIHEFVRRGFNHQFGKPAIAVQDDPEWQKIKATGTHLWLDTGDIEEASKLWNSSFEALTTNNTLLNKEIQKGIYDKLVLEAARAFPGIAVLEIAFILNAYHALRLVERFDAHVSVELHTDLSHDVERTVAYGKRYHAICPERFYVKVPLTPAGYLAARKLVQAGIPINFTLGFSARHNYLAALLTKPKFCNVFMGRLNSVVADNQLGSGDNVGEKATLATQRELIALRKAGRTETKLIGASVRTGAQIGELAGVDVLTMPTKAAAEYRAKPWATVASRVENDPAVDFAGGNALWMVTPSFKEAVEAVLKKADTLTPDELQAMLPSDFLPRWSDTDVKTATKDGKIPVWNTWRSRLETGEIGLDALMNLSALQSFATDQAALDDRIRDLISK